MDIEKAKKDLKGIDIRNFLSGMSEQSNYIVDRAEETNEAIEAVLNELEKKETLINTITMLKIENEEKIEKNRPYKDVNPFDFGVLNGIDEACRKILKNEKKDELKQKDLIINEMAKQIADSTQSCPFDIYDYESSNCNPEGCQNLYEKCWKEYFTKKAEGK